MRCHSSSGVDILDVKAQDMEKAIKHLETETQEQRVLTATLQTFPHVAEGKGVPKDHLSPELPEDNGEKVVSRSREQKPSLVMAAGGLISLRWLGRLTR